MMTLYLNQIAAIFYFSILSFCNHSTNIPVVQAHQPHEESVIGKWKYHLLICDGKQEKKISCFLTIDESDFTVLANEFRCNSCSKACVISENKIIFPEKNSSAICTLLECFENHREFCGNEKTLVYLFQDMEYKVDGNTLVLKSGHKTLTLERQS